MGARVRVDEPVERPLPRVAVTLPACLGRGVEQFGEFGVVVGR